MGVGPMVYHRASMSLMMNCALPPCCNILEISAVESLTLLVSWFDQFIASKSSHNCIIMNCNARLIFYLSLNMAVSSINVSLFRFLPTDQNLWYFPVASVFLDFDISQLQSLFNFTQRNFSSPSFLLTDPD